ncbi:MAG: oligosaccharide repeat unit polymerase [Bacilli bacterium]|nr:oligosaccharide repeat unit polymerase [Bacilli bacterium]
MFLNIILIGLLIFFIVKNYKLEDKANSKIKFCPNCGCDLYHLNNNKNDNHSREQEMELPQKKHEKVDDKIIKNNVILIIGSILIILSSIIFLTTTWYVTNSFIKILIIIMIYGVFSLSSFVAKKYLSLEKTSNIFFNISIFYIPIGLFSISSFSLLGEFLSINGSGRWIYLTISSILVSILYYFISKKSSSNSIFIMGVIFQYLSIAFFMNIISNTFIFIIIGLLFYNVLHGLLYNNNLLKYNKNLSFNLYKIIGISLNIISLYFSIFYLIVDMGSIENILFYLMLFIHNYYLYSFSLKKDNIFNSVFPLIIFTLIINISSLISFNQRYIQVFILIGCILIYLINYIKDNKTNIFSLIYVNSSIMILWIYTILSNNILLNSSIILLSWLLLNLINFIYKRTKINSYLVSISLYLLIINLLYQYNLPIILSFTLSLSILCLNIYNPLNELKESLKIISLINSFMVITYYSLYEIDNKYFLIGLIIYYIVMNVYNYIYNNDKYRFISYISMVISIISLSNIFNLDIYNYIFTISISLILFLEKFIFNQRSKIINYLLLVLFLIAFLILNVNVNISSFIVLIISAILYVLYIRYYNKSEGFYYILGLSLIPYLYFNYNLIAYNYLSLINICVIIMLIYINYIKRKPIFYNLFYLFIILSFITNMSNIYIVLLLGLVGTFIIYLFDEEYKRDVLKFIMYLFMLLIYKNGVIDLNFSDISILNYGIYVLFIVLISRTIIKNNSDNYRVFEYVSLVLLYLNVLFNYSSEIDSVIFIFLLVGIVILSYIHKLGPLFIVSLIAIIFNVFVLTKVFWFNIPWWIYILIVGIILVVFAVRNETKENTSKNIQDKINDFKDRFDV